MANAFDYKYCLSCGLQIVEGKLNFGTNADHSKNQDYCELCMRQGRLITSDFSKEQIIEQSTQAFVNRFGWKNINNARFEARNRIALSSRFGAREKKRITWKAKLIMLIIVVVTTLILRFFGIY